MDGAAPSGPASQALIALYCTTASQTAVGIRIMLVKKQISGRTLKTCILPGDAGEPGATHRGNHTHCFSRCIRYQRLESQTSMSSVSDLPTHFREAPRILERAAISFSRGSSRPRDSTWVSGVGRQIPYRLSHQGRPLIMDGATEMQYKAQFNPRRKNISYLPAFHALSAP